LNFWGLYIYKVIFTSAYYFVTMLSFYLECPWVLVKTDFFASSILLPPKVITILSLFNKKASSV